jgi:L-iditol 2-dehydrogenase
MKGFAKLAGERGSMGVIDVEEPTPAPDEALVEVAYAGLCGSDLGIYEFEDAFEFMEFPRVVGHEYAGTVVAVGDDVERFEPGDRVVEQIIRHCGECPHCLAGDTHICTDARITGIHHDGAYAPHITVPEKDLHHLRDDVTLREGATVEPTAVAARAVTENSRVRAESRVLVEGPGPIGLLAAQIARAQGAEVLVSGAGRDSAYRLPLAREMGFETVDVAETDVEAVTDERTDVGWDVVFDTTGHPSGISTAADVVKKGGQVVVLGLTDHAEFSLTPLVRGEVDVQCSYTYRWADFETAMDLIASGAVDVETLVDERFSLTAGTEAFEAAANAETCKPLFDLDDLRE